VAGDSNNCYIYSKGTVRQCLWDGAAIPGLIPPADLVPILLGKGKLAFRNSKQLQSFSDNSGRLTQLIARRETNRKGQSPETIRVTIGDYRIVSGLRVPFSFAIENMATTNHEPQEKLTLNYYHISLDPTILPSTFDLNSTSNKAQPIK
jgi:hypothetical protein